MTDQDQVDIEQIFQSGGWLDKQLTGYHARPGQIALARQVGDAIRDSRHLIAEAPTGVGKSLATGIPAAMWAMQARECVCMVTSTITLQEQLIGKDLPFIAQLLKGRVPGDQELRYGLVKGMGNYLCPLKLDVARDEHPGEPWLTELDAWVNGRDCTGDRSDLDVEYPDEQWQLVATNTHECVRDQCPYLKTESCPYHRAREARDTAHVIVTNYHMLFSDVQVRNMTDGAVSLLPRYRVLVLDEAHDAPAIAMDFLGFQLRHRDVQSLVGRLTRLKGKDQEVQELSVRFKEAVGQLFQRLAGLQASKSVRGRQVAEPLKILDRPLGQFDDELFGCYDQVSGSLVKMASMYQLTASETGKRSANQDDSTRALVKAKRLRRQGERCLEAVNHLESVFEGEQLHEDFVYYLERDILPVSICCKNVQVGRYFQEDLLPGVTCVAVSATMTSNNNFKFLAEQMGFQDDQYASMIAPSPFDPDRVIAYIPDVSFPTPDNPAFQQAMPETIAQLARLLGGRTMALFTSNRNLEHAHRQLTRLLPDYQLLVQGQMPKTKIIKQFKQLTGERAVILATSSFWQGVDIPGQQLSCVVIDKLPFATPDDPVLFHVERQHPREGFWKYSIPKATITLKQGIGRLIRTEQDYGAIAILDVRIRTKQYGDQFLKALPVNCVLCDGIQDIESFMQTF